MALLSFLNPGLQAGIEGDDLATTLRMKKLKEAQAQAQLQDEMRQRQARALLGQVPGQSSVPMERPAFQRLPNAGPGGVADMPGAVGGGFGGGMRPDFGAVPPGATDINPPIQTGDAGGSPSEPGPSGAATSAGGTPALPAGGVRPAGAGTTPFSWQAVMDEVRKRTDADPATIFAAMQEVAPQLEKEDQRRFLAEQQAARLQQKTEGELRLLQWRYANTDSQLEKAKLMGEIKLKQTELQGQTARDVATISAGSRENVARIGAAAKLDLADKNNLARAALADVNNRTNEKIAANALAYKKEYGDAFLDMKADEIGKSFIVKQRALDLQQQGLDQKQANFVANLEANQAKWQMQDETARRGQDLAHQDRMDAESGRMARNQQNIDAKTLITRTRDAKALDAANNRLDDFANSARELLMAPGFDDAFGKYANTIPEVARSQDVVNVYAKLRSLSAEKGLAVIQALKEASATGGSGFGRITNYEMQQFQNSIRSLERTQDPETMRKNLMDLINFVNTQKMRAAQAYEKQYGNQPGSGSPPVARPGSAGPSSGKTITIDGSVPKGARKQVKGVWYTSRGDGTAVAE